MIKSVIRSIARRKGYAVVPLESVDSFRSQKRLMHHRTVRTILDVGANVGETVARYREMFPEALIHAFEPFSECANKLRTRFAGDRGVRILSHAVADSCGARRFFVSNGNTTHSLRQRPRDQGFKYYGVTKAAIRAELEVSVTTLDVYCNETRIDHVDILKIDVEGAEREVLDGAQELLDGRKIASILMEVTFIEQYAGQALFRELCHKLAGFGYTLFDLFDLRRSTSTGQLRWGNAIFIEDGFREEIESRARRPQAATKVSTVQQ